MCECVQAVLWGGAEDNLEQLALSYDMDPWDQTQTAGLGSKCLYKPSHLDSPSMCFWKSLSGEKTVLNVKHANTSYPWSRGKSFLLLNFTSCKAIYDSNGRRLSVLAGATGQEETLSSSFPSWKVPKPEPDHHRGQHSLQTGVTLTAERNQSWSWVFVRIKSLTWPNLTFCWVSITYFLEGTD